MARSTLVLCYHALSERWPAVLAVTPEAFEAQLRLLLGRGYRGTTFSEAVRSPGRRTLAVTFDDAYRSVYELARPILGELGLPATVFVPTAFAGSEKPMSWPGIERWLGGPHERELVPMSWEELGELAEAGWEIGSHTRTHPRLTELDDEALAVELEGSRADCEAALQAPCRSLAYPYGDEDERVVAAAGAAGYMAAGALPQSFAGASHLRWPRVGVYRPDDHRRFAIKTSPGVLALRASRGWSVPAGIRRLARRRP